MWMVRYHYFISFASGSPQPIFRARLLQMAGYVKLALPYCSPLYLSGRCPQVGHRIGRSVCLVKSH